MNWFFFKNFREIIIFSPFLLQYIPMPVLYGVLMYMGVSSLKGMQFIDRVGLIFMPPKYQPDYYYLRHVPIKKVHLFTFIQVWKKRSYFLLKENCFYFYLLGGMFRRTLAAQINTSFIDISPHGVGSGWISKNNGFFPN